MGDVDYDRDGAGYARQRRPDPRIAALVHRALGDAGTVLNVGAGAGSYEPEDRDVTAVEPSASMRAQRPSGLRPAVHAVAEDLPFADDSFDSAMAMLTVHQWEDPDRGLQELRRVSRGPVVVLTFDGAALDRFWLAEYVPELIEVERARFLPIEHIRRVLGGRGQVVEVPIPLDCVDGFTEAYYGRPEALLDPVVRGSQSAWGFVSDQAVDRGLRNLRDDLLSGAWDARHSHLRDQAELVGSLRLITSTPDLAGPPALLFSYGTLRQPEVQLATFGRRVDARPDSINGYELSTVTITDRHVIEASGSDTHPVLRQSSSAGASIDGVVLELTPAELSAADAYEVDDYVRSEVRLASGATAWVYVLDDSPRRRIAQL